MSLNERIALLSDKESIALLQRFAEAQPKGNVPTAFDAPVAKQLQEVLKLSTEPIFSTSDGEVARAALLVVASDPTHRDGMQALLDHAKAETFAIVETMLVVSAVLVVLQTHVKFERDHHGKWTLKLEKKPTDPDLLKDLVKKLISLGN